MKGFSCLPSPCPTCVPVDAASRKWPLTQHLVKAAATAPFVLAERPPADPLGLLQPLASQGFEAGKLWS